MTNPFKKIFRKKDTSIKNINKSSSIYKNHLNSLLALFQKTIKIDLYSPLKLVISIFLLNLISIFLIIFTNREYLTSANLINDKLGIIQVVFTFCIIFVSLLTYNYSPAISEEFSRRTMLSLVTKPISRYHIVIGKLFAIFIYNFVVNLISLLIICFTNYLVFPYTDMVLFFFSQFFFSLFILVFFSSFLMGLSMLLKDPKKVIMIPLLFILLLFFSVFFIKSVLISYLIDGQPAYEVFRIYIFDLGYHIMNVFMGILEFLKYPLSTEFGRPLVIWGTHKIIFDELSPEVDYAVRTNYCSPLVSLIILIGLGIIFSIVGFLVFKKREIH